MAGTIATAAVVAIAIFASKHYSIYCLTKGGYLLSFCWQNSATVDLFEFAFVTKARQFFVNQRQHPKRTTSNFKVATANLERHVSSS